MVINPKIKISEKGPYLVSGNIPLKKEIIEIGKEDEPETWKDGEKYPIQENYALCRCGNSNNKPFCDGSHDKGFDCKETASKKKYIDQSNLIEGPLINLNDAESLCAAGRFCHRGGGTWSLVKKDDKESCKIAVESACNCPSGRLVIYDKKTLKPIENKYDPSISLIEDPQAKVSGPIWVKGGIQVQSCDGTDYEIRNRVTLCRCGNSNNKPFCDGSHIPVKFNDGDKSLK
jgi:CDGSH-type Zn-finger protein